MCPLYALVALALRYCLGGPKTPTSPEPKSDPDRPIWGARAIAIAAGVVDEKGEPAIKRTYHMLARLFPRAKLAGFTPQQYVACEASLTAKTGGIEFMSRIKHFTEALLADRGDTSAPISSNASYAGLA